MPNTEATAARWVELLAARSELPFAAELREHFAQAQITRLCDCGCNSFECSVAPAANLRPLFGGSRDLPSFEAAFASSGADPIDVVFYVDERGYLSGIDIHLGLSNHAPMPENAVIGRLLFSTPSL